MVPPLAIFAVDEVMRDRAAIGYPNGSGVWRIAVVVHRVEMVMRNDVHDFSVVGFFPFDSNGRHQLADFHLSIVQPGNKFSEFIRVHGSSPIDNKVLQRIAARRRCLIL